MEEATPQTMLPNTNPRGFPALNAAKADVFLLEGVLYAAPRIPIAGGTTIAEGTPSAPHMISIQYEFCANPVRSTRALNEPIPAMNMSFRPTRSAS
jgi:hypothetical protein